MVLIPHSEGKGVGGNFAHYSGVDPLHISNLAEAREIPARAVCVVDLMQPLPNYFDLLFDRGIRFLALFPEIL